MKTRIAFPQSTSSTCESAKKYNGDKKIEKGSRSNLIVEAESTGMFSVS